MSLDFGDLKRRSKESTALGDDVWEATWAKWRRFRHCPDNEESAAYCEGTLSIWRRARVRWHLPRCSFCQAELALLRDVLGESESSRVASIEDSVSYYEIATGRRPAIRYFIWGISFLISFLYLAARTPYRQMPSDDVLLRGTLLIAILIFGLPLLVGPILRVVSLRRILIRRGMTLAAATMTFMLVICVVIVSRKAQQHQMQPSMEALTAITMAANNLRAGQARAEEGKIEGILKAKQDLNADIEQLDKLDKLLTRSSPEMRRALETARTDLAQTLKWYSSVEAALKSDKTLAYIPARQLEKATERTLSSLKRAEALLVKNQSGSER